MCGGGVRKKESPNEPFLSFELPSPNPPPLGLGGKGPSFAFRMAESQPLMAVSSSPSCSLAQLEAAGLFISSPAGGSPFSQLLLCGRGLHFPLQASLYPPPQPSLQSFSPSPSHGRGSLIVQHTRSGFNTHTSHLPALLF